MDSEQIRQQIRENATEIVRLHARVRETYAQRSKSAEKMQAWKRACAETHSRYAGLAFPGGEQGDVLKRILAGDPRTMESNLLPGGSSILLPVWLHVQGYSAEMLTSAIGC